MVYAAWKKCVVKPAGILHALALCPLGVAVLGLAGTWAIYVCGERE